MFTFIAMMQNANVFEWYRYLILRTKDNISL